MGARSAVAKVRQGVGNMGRHNLDQEMPVVAAAAGAAPFGITDRGQASSHVHSYPFFNHYRGIPTRDVLRYKRGKLIDEGQGLSFFFRQINTAIAEVPTDDQEVPFMLRAQSKDYQDVHVQGIVTYRISDPKVTAARIDFTIDLDTGRYRSEPRLKIESFLTQLVEESVWSYFANNDLQALMTEGVDEIRNRIIVALGSNAVSELGLSLVSASVSSLKPRADVEKALQTTTFEALQEQADQATFDRRAKAVEKERIIQQNELTTQLELAKNREAVIQQEAVNNKRQTEAQAEQAMINTEGQVERSKLILEQKVDDITKVGEATAEAEKAKLEAIAGLSPEVLMALALQKLAENVPQNLRTLTITPDTIAQVRMAVEEAD
ncbi:MAG TPA: hypothetical protein VJ742_13290 [Nitrososphaera sp.]|nr:hypothetical protein [Nitrososphaera sp.]